MSTLQMIPSPSTPLGSVRWVVLDSWVVLRRAVDRIRREPERIILGLAFPVISVLLFAYVFGSAISVGGGNYREYLMPGLYVQSMVIGVLSTMTVTANDMARGVIDRFRSMPMSRPAVAVGYTTAELFNGTLALILMVLCGLAVGWRAHDGLARALAGFALLLLLRYALGWIGLYVGMVVRSPEVASQLFPLIFPITMIANTFVPTDNMPTWLRTVSEWNPVSATVAACRTLFGNPGRTPAGGHHVAWPLAHPVAGSLGWSLIFLAIFVPLAVRRYRRLSA
jgi:ABC-2 type transport system permease protein